MHDHPNRPAAPLPPRGEAQLELLLSDFRGYHAQRRRRRRAAGSAAFLAAAVIITCAVWIRLSPAPFPADSSQTPRMAERHDDEDRSMPAPPHVAPIAPEPPRHQVRIVRLTDSAPSTVRTIHAEVTATRITTSESSVIRIGDGDALRMLEATGRSTGIIRIGNRVLLADEVQRSVPWEDDAPTSWRGDWRGLEIIRRLRVSA